MQEIEDYLQTHPDITKVHVFGIKDELFGEVVCASISLCDDSLTTADNIKNYIAKGKLHTFKIPRYVQFRDTFPKTGSGKIQKQEVERRIGKET